MENIKNDINGENYNNKQKALLFALNLNYNISDIKQHNNINHNNIRKYKKSAYITLNDGFTYIVKEYKNHNNRNDKLFMELGL